MTWPIKSLRSDTSCRLCQTLHGMLVRTPGIRGYLDGNARGTTSLLEVGAEHSQYLTLSLEFSDAEMQKEPLDCSYTLHPISSTTAGRNFNPFEFDPALVGTWLEDCDSTHSCLCGSDQHANANFHVIDVVSHCVVRASPACRYVALSYVWGGVHQLRLRKSNIDLMVSEGYLLTKPIPQTIKDAFAICSLLGIQYLWVDRLCIVQDSMCHANSQVAHMQ